VLVDGKANSITLTDVLYCTVLLVPELKGNFISLIKVSKNGKFEGIVFDILDSIRLRC